MDGNGYDIWNAESIQDKVCDAIICTIDLLKKDSEIKILIGAQRMKRI